MSREVIDELVENIVGEDLSFPEILESIIEYGFADETELCELLEIDDAELDELASTDEHLTGKQLKVYRSRLVKYLNKLRKSYDKIYYRDE